MRFSLVSMSFIATGLIVFTASGCGSKSGDNGATASINNAKTTSGSTADPNYPEVLLETTAGNIRLKLDARLAPLTVNNFLSYIDEGFYTQTLVHSVFPGQGMVAGGFNASYEQKRPHPPIRSEADNGLKNRRLTVAMMREPDVIDSASSMFFINVADNPALNYTDRTPEKYGYCVFGEVIEGQNVVETICTTPVQDTPQVESTPKTAVVIKSARRIK